MNLSKPQDGVLRPSQPPPTLWLGVSQEQIAIRGNEEIEQRNVNKVQRVAAYLVVLLLVDLGRLQRLGLPSCKAKPSRRVRTLENGGKNNQSARNNKRDPTRSLEGGREETTIRTHLASTWPAGADRRAKGGETLDWRAPRQVGKGKRGNRVRVGESERRRARRRVICSAAACARRDASPWESFRSGEPGPGLFRYGLMGHGWMDGWMVESDCVLYNGLRRIYWSWRGLFRPCAWSAGKKLLACCCCCPNQR